MFLPAARRSEPVGNRNPGSIIDRGFGQRLALQMETGAGYIQLKEGEKSKNEKTDCF
jgi:hypothetical protein